MPNPYDQFDANPYDKFDAPRSLGQEVGRQLGLAARVIPEVIGSAPLAAMDAGVGVRNLLTGSDYESPSTMFSQGLDQIFPKRETGLETGVGIAANVVAGSKLPMPTVKGAPANFANPQAAIRTQAVQAAQKEGYVIPPSQGNPTFLNRFLEGISGKLKLQQEAAARNQGVTQRLGAESVGQRPDAVLTEGGLGLIRGEAHAAGYEPVKAFGKMTADSDYLNQLDALVSKTTGAARSFPGLKPDTGLEDTIKALRQNDFDAGDAVDAISHLRNMADDAFSAGKKSLGRDYKAAAKAIEDVIERNLSRAGQNGGELLKGYREARQLIAKTYTMGKALLDDTGTIDPRKLASELSKGKPLTGEQRAIAEFTRMFPKVSVAQREAFPSISPLDAYGSAIAAGASDSMVPLGIPLTRVGVREYLLSQAGQRNALAATYAPRQTIGVPGAASLNALSLFGQ